MLLKLDPDKAYTTSEILQFTAAKRCSQLRRLHRLERAGVLERKMSGGKHYWRVVRIPEVVLEKKTRKEEPEFHYEEVIVDGKPFIRKVYHLQTGANEDESAQDF